MNRLVAIFILSSVAFISCNNRDKKAVKFISADAVYFDYQVWGDDEKKEVTVMLQYRAGDADGKAIALNSPSKAALDERELEPDSTKSSGVYYEYSTTIDSFAGTHSIVFTDKTGRKYVEKFEFRPFYFTSAWPDTLYRADLEQQLEGLDKEDYIRIIAIDTAFRSRGINQTDTVKNGRLFISKARLKSLVNGPIRIEFYKELEIPVKNATSAGGYLLITYGIKRNVELRD